jgi:O-antigen/teichoic acid export membrane protein
LKRSESFAFLRTHSSLAWIIVSKGTVAATLILYNRLLSDSLSPSELGRYYTITAILSMCFVTGLVPVQRWMARDRAVRGDEPQKRQTAFSTRRLFSYLFLHALFTLSAAFFLGMFHVSLAWPTALLVASAGTLGNLLTLHLAVRCDALAFDGLHRVVNKVGVFESIFRNGSGWILAAAASFGLVWAALLPSLSKVVTVLLFTPPRLAQIWAALRPMKPNSENGVKVEQVFRFGAPIALTSLFLWGHGEGMRLIVSRTLGFAEAGSIGLTASIISSLFVIGDAAMMQFLQPRIASFAQNTEGATRTRLASGVYRSASSLFAVYSGVMALGLPLLWTLAVERSHWKVGSFIGLLFVSEQIKYASSPFSSLLMIEGKTLPVLYASIVCIVVTLLSAGLFASSWGLHGVAFSMLLGSASLFGVLAVSGRKVIGNFVGLRVVVWKVFFPALVTYAVVVYGFSLSRLLRGFV